MSDSRAASRNEILANPRLAWMLNSDIRPYVFVRPENRVEKAGALHSSLDWFQHQKVLYKNPLEMHEVSFANRILTLEERAFGPSNMAMPRWVFYDCAIVPGFVAGFAHRTATLPESVRAAVDADVREEWTPLSLFIIIPTMSRNGEWTAHNLCSVNSLLAKPEQFFAIGFLSKAFGLWYANVRTCIGMTQWGSPSVRLHAHYGEFEVLTAYTPVHSYARTLTYRVNVDTAIWPAFFSKMSRASFHLNHEPAGFEVDPGNDENLKSFQTRLEAGQGPFFLDGGETVAKDLSAPLSVFKRKA